MLNSNINRNFINEIKKYNGSIFENNLFLIVLILDNVHLINNFDKLEVINCKIFVFLVFSGSVY